MPFQFSFHDVMTRFAEDERGVARVTWPLLEFYTPWNIFRMAKASLQILCTGWLRQLLTFICPTVPQMGVVQVKWRLKFLANKCKYLENYKIEAYFQWKTNKKSYVTYRLIPLLVTLNDSEGHSPVAGLFKCNSSNFCAAFYQISTDSVLARSLGDSWASCKNYFTFRISRKFAKIRCYPSRSHHTSSVSLHYLVKCQVSKSTIENKTTSVITHFIKLITGSNTAYALVNSKNYSNGNEIVRNPS